MKKIKSDPLYKKCRNNHSNLDIKNMQSKKHLGLNDWKNKDNCVYYDNIPIEDLQSFAIKGGFENGCDIDLIYEYLKDKKSILEVGAAYGRVIKNILSRGYTGKLYALERSPQFYRYLLTNFGDQAEIIYDNAQIFQPTFKVDIILMLWGFVFDFSKLEQLELLRRAISWLKPKGFIVLETMPRAMFPKTAVFLKNQTYIFLESGTNYGYATSEEEIDEYAKQLKVKYVEHIKYKTDTQRERILHILKT